ncbi:hypothetical protein BDV93DRAFT_53387 [Ceratobasidium sp. AG-I]|nr:hypothetical protein BDV93DRAFT_53387 [Ceratobasidium sp. AG-I]
MVAGNRNNASEKSKAPAKKHQHDDSDEVDGDDISEPEPPQKRPRKETAWKRDARQNNEEEQDARKEKRQASEQHRQERSDVREAAMFVEDDNKTERETIVYSTFYFILFRLYSLLLTILCSCCYRLTSRKCLFRGGTGLGART